MGDSNSNDDDNANSTEVVRFPHSRTRPASSQDGIRELGNSKMAQQLGRVQPNLKGHWCSRCKGIWYGFVGECECPVCGNRNG
ncbi:MAG: hypothetical protein CME32_19200 [Gimesia sp.]|nr:hypothetical protein [Porticoccaceae bacterium]MBN71396.1 hypothetical protein [Gimesia sp.]